MTQHNDVTRREELRQALRSGNVGEADAAMQELLAPGRPTVETEDVALTLDAMDRLGTPALSRMAETFLLLVQEHLPIAQPAVVERIERTPLSGAGDLAASVVCEVLQWTDGGLARLDRERVLHALIVAVEHASRTRCDRSWSAVSALALWSALAPIGGAGAALVGLVSRAAELEEANMQLVRDAVEALRRSGRVELWEPLRDLAARLPPDHPLHTLLV